MPDHVATPISVAANHWLQFQSSLVGRRCIPSLRDNATIPQTQIHNRFTTLFPGLHGWAGGRKKLLLDFMVQEEISEADIRLGATPSGLISDPPPSSPPFLPRMLALPAATLPIYPGLEQASNMLACIPSGLVQCNNTTDILITTL